MNRSSNRATLRSAISSPSGHPVDATLRRPRGWLLATTSAVALAAALGGVASAAETVVNQNPLAYPPIVTNSQAFAVGNTQNNVASVTTAITGSGNAILLTPVLGPANVSTTQTGNSILDSAFANQDGNSINLSVLIAQNTDRKSVV